MKSGLIQAFQFYQAIASELEEPLTCSHWEWTHLLSWLKVDRNQPPSWSTGDCVRKLFPLLSIFLCPRSPLCYQQCPFQATVAESSVIIIGESVWHRLSSQ